MRSLPILLLLALAAGLSGLIAWQWMTAAREDAVAIRPPETAPAVTAPAPAPPDRAAALEATSLARPLFSPDRRPPAPGSGPAGPRAAPLPRLTGILVTPAGSSAIFAGGPPPVVVAVGGKVGTFTVRAIEPGQVTLLGPDGLRTVRPSFGAGAPAPGQAAAALPVPPPPAGPPGLKLPFPPLPTGGDGPPRATSLDQPNAPKDAMPFEQNPAPSGLEIIRNRAANAQAPAQ